MRAVITVSILILAGIALSGCAVAEVGGAVVGAGVSAVGTVVDVTGDVVGAATGGSSDDKSKN